MLQALQYYRFLPILKTSLGLNKIPFWKPEKNRLPC